MLVLCFSLFGYRLVIDLLQETEARAMATAINTEAYADDALVSLKVPAELPYYTNSAQYAYVNGTITIDGIIYQYVKCRIFADSIEYLCLRDPAQTRLQGAREQFFQLAYDLQMDKSASGNNHNPVKPLMLEYCVHDKWVLEVLPPNAAIKNHDAGYLLLPAPIHGPAPQPPETGLYTLIC